MSSKGLMAGGIWIPAAQPYNFELQGEDPGWRRMMANPSDFEEVGTTYLRYNLTVDEPGNPARTTIEWEMGE